MANPMPTQKSREDYDFRADHFKFVQDLVHEKVGIG